MPETMESVSDQPQKKKPGPKPKQEAKIQEAPQPTKRRFSDSVVIFHDLFKLEMARMKKNLSWNKIPQMQEIEHCHFFHSFDSSGKKQTESTPVGGHFHLIETKDNGPNEPCDVVSISQAMKWGKQVDRKTGRFKKVPVPVDNEVDPEFHDSHTHEVTYLQSNEVKMRKMNTEAAKLISSNAALTQKPKGLDVE